MVGSANATGLAFGGNTEFLIELALDPKEEWTIERFMDEGNPTSLRAMLIPYQPAGDEPAEPTAVEEATRRLDAVLRDLATASYTVHVIQDTDTYRLDLGWPQLSPAMQTRIDAQNLAVTIGPATTRAATVAYTDGGATIASATLQAVTSFLVIEARTRVDGCDIVGRTLVNARLTGAPADRKDQLLAATLDDPDSDATAPPGRGTSDPDRALPVVANFAS